MKPNPEPKIAAAVVETDLEKRTARVTTTAPEAAIRAAMVENGYMEA